MRWLLTLLGLLAMTAGLLPAAAQAQTAERCFAATGYCISGPIREYWERNGGLPVFGYPITPQRLEQVENVTVPVQWFERDRLEDQTARGLGVLAGRLGAEYLQQAGTPWRFQALDPQAPGAGCRGFPTTGYYVCGPFLDYWQQNGGLERFGYPITGMVEAVIEGRTLLVQYFERRRMELHPEGILLGLLGRDLQTGVAADLPWRGVSGIPADLDLRAVVHLDANTAFGIGNRDNRGQIFRMQWRGASWDVVFIGFFDQRVNDLAVVSADNIWVVGDNSAIYHLAGSEWQLVPAPVGGAELNAIQMLGAGDQGWIGGRIPLPRDPETGVDGETLLLQYRGGQWQRDEAVRAPGRITDLHFAPGAGWAIAERTSFPDVPRIWRYSDGSWRPDSDNDPCLGNMRCDTRLQAVRAIDADSAWIAGIQDNFVAMPFPFDADRYIVKRENGSWRRVSSGVDHAPLLARTPQLPPAPARVMPYGLYFADAGHGLMVGQLNDYSFIYRYGGAEWRNQPLPPVRGGLFGVSMAGPDRALAVGAGGVVLSYGYE